MKHEFTHVHTMFKCISFHQYTFPLTHNVLISDVTNLNQLTSKFNSLPVLLLLTTANLTACFLLCA